MKLRPYQAEAVEATIEAFTKGQSALTVMPTGTGKTVYFAHVIDRRREAGRTMVVAHRRELLDQASRKIEAVTGERPDVEIADEYSAEHALYRRSRIVVSTVQTQVAGYRGDQRRMQRFKPEDFGTLVVDEAHHSPSATYRMVIDHYHTNPALRTVGVTATPDRHDEKALGLVYDTVAYEMSLLTAIDGGWLVPIRQSMIEVDAINLTNVKTTAGDLNARQLAAVMEAEKALWGVVSPTIEFAGTRQTLVFAASVEHATRMAEMIDRIHPGKAAVVTGKTDPDERNMIMRRFAEKDLQFLCNVDVATEGVDIPSVEVVAIARPTKSRARYAQMVGRGTRPVARVDDYDEPEARRRAIEESEKPGLSIIDFVGVSGQHKLISTADLLGGDYTDDVIELAVRHARERGAEVDMRDEIKRAVEERRRAEEIERSKRSGVRGTANYRSFLRDPFNVLDLAPEREKPYFAGRPATDAQIAFLEKARVPDPQALNRQQASQLQREIIRRWRERECTFRMAAQFKQRGYPTRMKMDLARQVMDALAGNKWNPLPDNHALTPEKVRYMVDPNVRGPVRV